MQYDSHDVEVLRNLARKIAQIASLPVQRERERLWKDFNSLRPRRPMILASPEGGWIDLISGQELLCRDEHMRNWEWGLRERIFRHEHIKDDQP